MYPSHTEIKKNAPDEMRVRRTYFVLLDNKDKTHSTLHEKE
jgi:hypothetical protein